jgi:hypothetical protein
LRPAHLENEGFLYLIVRMSINSEAEGNPPSPGKRQVLDVPDSPTKKLGFSEMSLEPQSSRLPLPEPGVPQLPIPDAGGVYRNNSLNFIAPKKERRRSFEREQNEAHFSDNNEGPVLSRRSSLDDGTLTRKGKKVQVGESDSDAASSAAASAVDSTVYSDIRPTFVTISRPRLDAGSRWIDPSELLNQQRNECNASKDPKVHFEFAKACLSNGEPVFLSLI